MVNNVTISVIVPIYGVEKYISRFAVSLLSQSYEGLQFIFVNDGTKDGSMTVLRNLIDERFSHLKDRIVLVDKENEGCPKARRTGLDHATGDYVMHADPDDWYEDGAFEKIAAVAETTGADLIYCDYFKEYQKNSKHKTKHKKENLYTIEQKNDYIRDMYNHKACGCVWNKCVKRSVYLENRIYYPQTSCAEDVCLTTQLAAYSRSIVHLCTPVYHYRRDNPTSVSRRNPKFRRYRAVEKFLDLYEFYGGTSDEECPVSVIFDDIMMKAGWSSIMYRFGLFDERPYLAAEVGRIAVSRKRETPVVAQMITKGCAFLYRIKNKQIWI